MNDIRCPYSLTTLRLLYRKLRSVYSQFSENPYIQESYNYQEEIIDVMHSLKGDLSSFAYDLPSFLTYLEDKVNVLSVFRKVRFSKGKAMTLEEDQVIKKYHPNLPKDLEILNAFITTEYYIANLASLLGKYFNFTESISKLYQQNGTYCPEGYKLITSEYSGDLLKTEKKAETVVKTFLKLKAVDFTQFIIEDRKNSKKTGNNNDNDNDNKKDKKAEYLRSLLDKDFYPLKDIVAFAENYRRDIFKITFAIRAEVALRVKNEQIKFQNSRYDQRTPKITKKYFGEVSGLEKTTVSNYFIGKTLPSMEFLLLFSTTLNVSMHYLLDPTIKIGNLKSELDDLDYSFVLTQESEFILRLLNGLWATGGIVKADQSDIIQKTLDFLIRDVFCDYTGEALLPTVNKDIDLGLCKTHQNFQNIHQRLKEGSLRFNRESVLFLLGRYIFDPYKKELDKPSELHGAVSIVNTTMLHNLWNTLEKEDLGAVDYKQAIGEFVERTNSIYNLDYSDNKISQYLMENILDKVRQTLTKYQEQFEKGELAQKLNFDSTYPTDYDEKEDMREEKPAKPNLGFSDTYPPKLSQGINSMIETLRDIGYMVTPPEHYNPLPDHRGTTGADLEGDKE